MCVCVVVVVCIVGFAYDVCLGWFVCGVSCVLFISFVVVVVLSWFGWRGCVVRRVGAVCVECFV